MFIIMQPIKHLSDDVCDFISSFQCFVGDGPTGVVFGHQRAPQRSRPNVTPEKVLRRSFYSFFFGWFYIPW